MCITYSECVPVDIFIQYAILVCRILLSLSQENFNIKGVS